MTTEQLNTLRQPAEAADDRVDKIIAASLVLEQRAKAIPEWQKGHIIFWEDLNRWACQI